MTTEQKFRCPKCFFAEIGECGMANAIDNEIANNNPEMVKYHIQRSRGAEFVKCALPHKKAEGESRGTAYLQSV
jgi:hypothetical protein